MRLRHLQRFIAVAEELHFGKAAQRLNISQPPLSLSIQQLEERLGIQLFIRNNKSVVLTDAGKIIYKEALTLFNQIEKMMLLSKNIADGVEGYLKIGFNGTALFRGLPTQISQFQKAYPRVDIIYRELNTIEQIDDVQQGLIDIGFIHGGTVPTDLSSQKILSEPFLCCLPKSHPLSEQESINIIDLAEENFLLFPRYLSPTYHDNIISICVNAGFNPKIKHEIRNWLTIIELIGHNIGVSLVPYSLKQVAQNNVVYRPINEIVFSEMHAIWAKNDPPTVLKTLIDFLNITH